MLRELKKLKSPIRSLMSEGADFHVEIDKCALGLRATASGVKRISELSETSISLKTKGYTLVVGGKRLSLSIYENKTVEISGKIEVMKFENSQN